MENNMERSIIERFFAVHNLMTAYKRTRTIEFRGDRIYPSEIQVLELLSTRPMTKITEVAETLYISASAASQLVKKLSARELIIKKRNLMNERIVHLTLTPEGEELAARAAAEEREVLSGESGITSSMNAGEIRSAEIFLMKTEELLKSLLAGNEN